MRLYVGAPELNFYQEELDKNEETKNFKIAIGNEIYLTGTRSDKQRYYHFILIAKNRNGYQALKELSSYAWMNSYWDRGLERVPTLYNEIENIVNFILWCKEQFGNDFYIECAPGCSSDQIKVNKRLVSIAKAFGLKMVIGSDAHYLKKEDRYVHKAYLNSKGGEREVDEFYEYAYLQSDEEEMQYLSKSDFDPDFVKEMWENSLEIYGKIEKYSIRHKQTIPKVEVDDYPKVDKMSGYPILNSMFKSDDKIERYWVNKCVNRLEKINKLNGAYLARLEEEADIKRTIGEKLETNMFAYPVTLQHYVNLFWDCGSIVGAGRGSSCSGLNHYLLGITQLDPIQWELPFWRLELLRNSLPA